MIHTCVKKKPAHRWSAKYPCAACKADVKDERALEAAVVEAALEYWRADTEETEANTPPYWSRLQQACAALATFREKAGRIY